MIVEKKNVRLYYNIRRRCDIRMCTRAALKRDLYRSCSERVSSRDTYTITLHVSYNIIMYIGTVLDY